MFLHKATGQYAQTIHGRRLYFGTDLERANQRFEFFSATGIHAKTVRDWLNIELTNRRRSLPFDEWYRWVRASGELIKTVGKYSVPELRFVDLWQAKHDELEHLADHENRVYFVADEQAGAIKIGRSRNFRARFSALKTSASSTLTCRGTVPGGEYEESYMHGRFRDLRIRGEWFVDAGELRHFLTTILN